MRTNGLVIHSDNSWILMQVKCLTSWWLMAEWRRRRLEPSSDRSQLYFVCYYFYLLLLSVTILPLIVIFHYFYLSVISILWCFYKDKPTSINNFIIVSIFFKSSLTSLWPNSFPIPLYQRHNVQHQNKLKLFIDSYSRLITYKFCWYCLIHIL